MQARKLYLDTVNRAFADAPNSATALPSPTWFAEDVEAIELYFYSGPNYLDYSANTVKLAVGLTAPAALQTSWTAISTAVTATITSSQTGGSGADAIQRISFNKTPIAGTFAIRLPSRNVTVSTVSAGTFTCSAAHGLVNGQNVTLTGFTSITGFTNGASVFVRDRTPATFAIANTLNGTAITSAAAAAGGTATVPTLTTAQMSWEATASTVQGNLAAVVGATAILVSGNFNDGFVATYGGDLGGVAFSNFSVVNNTLLAAPGLQANLSFNTNEVAALIAAGTTTGLRMEIEVSNGTLRQTYATTASIADDIITTSSPAPLPPGGAPYTTLTLNDGAGGNWALSVDSSGVVTTTKI